MARIHEYQGKSLLLKAGIPVPRGVVVRSPEEATAAAISLGTPVMVKVQAWMTGRAAAGGIARAQSPAQAGEMTAKMLALSFGKFPVTEVLIEECVAVAREFFVSLAIDECARAPVLLLSGSGGSGVEEHGDRTRRVACDVMNGPDRRELAEAVRSIKCPPEAVGEYERIVWAVFDLARSVDARSVEINPLAMTTTGSIVALDCRVTIDDYAVSRHPELGIEIAREFDHPPTNLERVAYRVEQEDHRGTFFFAQMNTEAAKDGRGLIGFHGAGGGGSMMSMDAVTAEGFTVANFCETSGNPSSAKVYHAARIILDQPGLVGYFGSGSGVANQEQFWSGYGLAKAFWELELSIPAVIRLGGNTEDRAVDILQSACAELPARVEGYKKNDTPAHVASRFAEMVREHGEAKGAAWKPRLPRRPAFVSTTGAPTFSVRGGLVLVDPEVWRQRASAIIARASGLLRDEGGVPALTVTPTQFAGKDNEMIACEVECRRDGIGGVFVVLDTPGLDGAAHREAAR